MMFGVRLADAVADKEKHTQKRLHGADRAVDDKDAQLKAGGRTGAWPNRRQG